MPTRPLGPTLMPHTPNQNHLIAAMPAAEFARLAGSLELVSMMLGEVLYEPGMQLRHAYFPTTAVVSLNYVTVTGACAETTGALWSSRTITVSPLASVVMVTPWGRAGMADDSVMFGQYYGGD